MKHVTSAVMSPTTDELLAAALHSVCGTTPPGQGIELTHGRSPMAVAMLAEAVRHDKCLTT